MATPANSRRTTSNQRNAAPSPQPQRRDRRLFWTRIVAGGLVIAMLLPILISFIVV